MINVTEINFDAYNHKEEIVQVSLILEDHINGRELVDHCRKVVSRNEELEEFIVIIRVNHIQVPRALSSSLPIIECGEPDAEPNIF